MIELTHLVLGPLETNCYFVRDTETGDLVIVDPAWYDPSLEGKVRDALPCRPHCRRCAAQGAHGRAAVGAAAGKGIPHGPGPQPGLHDSGRYPFL